MWFICYLMRVHIFFYYPVLLTDFQSHICKTNAHAFFFIIYLIILSYSRPSRRATNGQNLIGKKIKLHFYENYYGWPNHMHEQFKTFSICANAANVCIMWVCVRVHIIGNNVNSSPAMLAKWHSHTNSISMRIIKKKYDKQTKPQSSHFLHHKIFTMN